MNSALIRNYAVFFLGLVAIVTGLIYLLSAGNRALRSADDWINHSYAVILEAQRLPAATEASLSSQRGYLISGADYFLQRLHAYKKEVYDSIARLDALTEGNEKQKIRLTELKNYVDQFMNKLEERTALYTPNQPLGPGFLENVGDIINLRQDILRINKDFLDEEYSLLNRRVIDIENQKSSYSNLLLTGLFFSAGLLLLLNGYLLSAQRKHLEAEGSLRSVSQRLALAMEGTRDGIFDWDLATGQVFYSAQLFNMLGYKREAFTGTREDLRSLMHPEDQEKTDAAMKAYLESPRGEYSQEVRLKNSDGRWVWVNTRARAILSDRQQPTRIIGAHIDISAIKEREARLESARKLAEDANRAKSDFLAHMSHEIRTPLTAISGIAEILEKDKKNLGEKHQKLVRTLRSSSDVLKDLINDVLDFSKIETGELVMDDADFDLKSLFEEVISMMSVRANEKALSFVFDYTSLADGSFHGDRMRLRQILINLIGNAIKFTNEGGVKIKVYTEDRAGEKYLRADIADTGVGIAPENVDLVFERFKQADASTSRKYGGTGLGLPISKNLAKLMGGTIVLSSELGRGSTFSLLLPLRYGGVSEHEVSIDESPCDPELNKELKALVAPEHKILVVEDYEGNILVISYLLEEIGCAYDIARNGLEGLNMWKNSHYDIILMDVQMPVMDGFTATAAIRNLEKEQSLKRTTIIGMTAHALVGDKDKCIEAGMDAYLPKPIVETDLKENILKHLAA